MATSPSQRWEDGVLVERALSSIIPGAPVENDDDVSGTKPYKTPAPTKSAANRKAVTSASAENKAVKASTKK